MVGRLVLGPHRFDELDAIGELIEPLGVGRILIAVRVVFGSLPSGAQAKYKAPVTDLVERGSEFRGHRGRPERDRGDRRCEAYLSSQSRDPTQARIAF